MAKISLNSTIKPVSFDYAYELHKLGCLDTFYSAYPRNKSNILKQRIRSSLVFVDFVQIVFLVLYRICGSTKITRFISYLSKVCLDYVTANGNDNPDAIIFYSGAGLKTISKCRKQNIVSICQMHHTHIHEQIKLLKEESIRASAKFVPIYSDIEIARQLREYEKADLILCPSSYVKESFTSRGFPCEKLIVVHHGVDLQKNTKPSLKTDNFKFRPLNILYVGQLHYRKGLYYLQKALLELPECDYNCRLVGPDFGISGLDKSINLSNFYHVGIKKGKDLQAEYENADVFILPSIEEGFGLVVLEAMLYELPVIVTSAVGAKDFIRQGIEGWVVAPSDSNEIKVKLEWMKANPKERKFMGNAAHQAAISAGGWSESARKLVNEISLKISYR